MSAFNMNRPAYDAVLEEIAHYVADFHPTAEALDTARLSFIDALGCGLAALNYPACTKLLGPIIPGTVVPHGARVPGTPFQLDPVTAAFNIGTMIRWLDFNDTFLAAEWGHPSDNIGGILASADYLSRMRLARGETPLTIQSVLTAMVKAYEIQGGLALKNAFNKMGLDHVILIKVASTAVCAHLMGANDEESCAALSHAFVDGQSLRTYRHSPNTCSRKSWAAGEATSRGVRLALLSLKGEMGIPSVLTTPTWGFYDVYTQGQPFRFERPYGQYVIDNVLFKIIYPAEFHGQTAIECALSLHQQLKAQHKDASCIKKVSIRTQEACMRIIDKHGPLTNPADRDHCIQYMVAIALLFGRLTAQDYEDTLAADPRLDALRERIFCVEDPQFTRDYHDPEKRSIANALTIELNDGTPLPEVVCEYPIGHRRRRQEGLTHLDAKFRTHLAQRFASKQQEQIWSLCNDSDQLMHTAVNQFMDLWGI